MTMPQISSTVGQATLSTAPLVAAGEQREHGGDRHRDEADVDVERQRDDDQRADADQREDVVAVQRGASSAATAAPPAIGGARLAVASRLALEAPLRSPPPRRPGAGSARARRT